MAVKDLYNMDLPERLKYTSKQLKNLSKDCLEVDLDDPAVQGAKVCAGCFMNITMTNATNQASLFPERPEGMKTFPLVVLLHEEADSIQ